MLLLPSAMLVVAEHNGMTSLDQQAKILPL